MSGPAATFAREVAAVDGVTERRTDEYVHVYGGQLAGTDARFHVLAPEHGDDATVRAAFERAADQWERLDGRPPVVTVRARGEEPRPWIAVEEHDERHLGAVGPSLSVAALRSVLADAAEALHDASRAGIHGAGITPAHVRVRGNESGVTGAVDWGLDRACAVAAGDAGDSPYAAPELAADPTAATPGADVYALGAIAYEAATGVAPTGPFGPHEERPSDTHDTDAENSDDHPQPPSEHDASLPATFDGVVRRAMAADPTDRYGSPYEFKLAVLFDAQETAADGTAPTAGTQSPENSTSSSDDKGAVGDRQQEHDASTTGGRQTRRAALGVLGLAAVGGGLFAAGRLGDDDSQPAGGTGGTEGPPTATFAFEYEFGPEPEAGLLTITHTGGDGIGADSLVLVSDDLESSPVRWSDYRAYEPGDRIVAGDSLVIDLSSPFSVGVFWDSGDGFEELDNYEVQDQRTVDTPGPVPTGPPTASFTIEYADGVVTIGHEDGDPVAADALLVRGSGFAEAPTVRWSEIPDLDPETDVEPGDRVRLDAADDVVVHLLWKLGEDGEVTAGQWDGVLSRGGPRVATADRQAVLAQFYGPGRPLDAAIGGVPTGRYDATNTGAGADVTGPTSDVVEQWSFESGMPETGNLDVVGVMAPSPAVADGVIYAGSTDGALYAVDAQDGAELWRAGTGTFSSATVRDGTLYVGGADLVALAPSDGSVQWSVPTDRRIVGPPRVRDGTVYAASSGASGWAIRAVDADDGTVEWGTGVAEGGVRPPAVTDDLVYVSGGDVRALSADTGHTQWTYEAATGPTTPVVAEETVYVGEAGEDEQEGAVTALDRNDGTVRWHQSVPGPVFGAVAVADRQLYAAGGSGTDGTLDGGFLTAIDAADGTVVGTVEREAAVEYPPTVADGTLYVADEAGRITARNASEGVRRWTYRVEDTLRGPPVVADGRLFVVGEQNSLYALEEAADQ